VEDARRPWAAGLRAARAHLLPGLGLQALGLALVLSYYFWGWAREELDALMAFKTQVGFAFGIVSTAIFGGLLPWVYLWWDGRYSVPQGGWLLLFWGYKGFEVDVLYRLEARWIGAGHQVPTILRKMAFDQFVYGPLWAVPTMLVFYRWLESNSAPGGRAPPHRLVFAFASTIPLLISNVGVWLPMLALIYALPTPLQLPLQNLVLCFFTLIVAHQAHRPGGARCP